jgi:hypothetical protein
MYYRPVNQAERYQTVEMHGQATRFAAEIPGNYTNSPYPLQYYFELRRGPASAWLYPGLGPELMDQPYYVVRSTVAIRTPEARRTPPNFLARTVTNLRTTGPV